MTLYRLSIGSGRVRTHVIVEARGVEEAKEKGKEYDDREVTEIKEIV